MDIEDEPLTVGCIDVQEFRTASEQGRDIFVERVEQRIKEILLKYECALVVKSFRWSEGRVEGDIAVMRCPPKEG
jgi:hypothetical protein